MTAAPAPTALVLRALGLGDLLTAVPALRALQRALPEHRLTVATPRAWTDLLALADLDAEVCDASGLDRPLAPSGSSVFDLGVNLHGRGPESHRLLRPWCRDLVAFACSEVGVVGPDWRADEHERVRWCRLVSERLGAAADPDDVRLAVPDVLPEVLGAFVVHPGAAQAARQWPAERYAQVVRWAARRGHPVVLTGSASERPLAEEVARRSGVPAQVLAGRTTVVELAALVASAAVVVCGDTGVAHLASAYAVPSVLLFGPTPPARWGPPPGPHTVLWHENPGGNPWADRVDPALARIGTREVLAAVEARLALAPGGRLGV